MPVDVDVGPNPVPDPSRSSIGSSSRIPPEPGLGPAVAAWQPAAGRWARDCLLILAFYAGLAGLLALRRWRLDPGLLWLVAFSPVHMLAARRPPLAAGEAWLRVGRRRWVRLDRLRRVSVSRRTLTLGDTDRRQVDVDLDDLTANADLGALVLAAVLDSVARGQVRLGPVTTAMLGLPIQSRRRQRVSRRERRRRRRQRRLGLRHYPVPADPVDAGQDGARPALAGRAILEEAWMIVGGLLVVVVVPIILGWFAWSVLSAAGSAAGSWAASTRWLVYAASWLAGGLGIDTYFRLYERAEGPMGYAKRAGRFQRDPPPSVRARLIWADRLLAAGLLLSFGLVAVNELTLLLWLGAWTGVLVVTIVWGFVRWLPWLRGQPPPAPRPRR